MSSEPREFLRRRTGAARRRHAEIGATGPSDPASPVADVFVLAESAGHAVEWAVIETAASGRLVAVALDDQPLVGSADVRIGSPALDADGLRAPAVVRCAHAVELDAWRLSSAVRTGRLPRAAVEQACRVRRRLLAGEEVGRAIDRETDADPEYQAFLDDVVRPARDAVRLATTSPSVATPARRQQVRSGRPHAGWLRAGRVWAVAAALLLVAGAVMTWQLFRLQQQRTQLVAELEAAREPLAALEAADAELRRRLAEAEQDRADLQQRLEATEGAPSTLEALANLPLAVLVPGVRGEPEVVAVEAGSPWLGVVVELADPPHAASYEMQIGRLGGGAPVWRRGGLEPARGLLSVLLPSELVPPAAYRVQLRAPAEPEIVLTLIVERP